MRERLQELLQHLRFEANHPVARATPFTIMKKLVMLLPQGVMFLLFNFGSSFRRSDAAGAEQAPADDRLIAQIELPAIERGVPRSDDTVQNVVFHGYESTPDPLFAMTEIHRVLEPRGTVTLRVAGRFVDPRQRRIATREAVEPFTTGARGVPRLFEAVSASDDSIVLQSLKTTARNTTVRRIDIGCGSAKRAGFTGIDARAVPGVDIVRDVESHGLPFGDDTITDVYASHFLEHVRDLVGVMNEIHRVCCHGASVELIVPTLLGPWAAADPTHVRLFNARTFEYFTEARGAGEGYDGIAGLFQIVEQHVSTSLRVRLRVYKPR